MRKRFGFVRFTGVHNCDLMIKKLCDIWFGFHKLFASLPHNRKNDLPKHMVPSLVEKHGSLNNSYASVVRGHKDEKFTKDSAETIIDIESGDYIVDNKKLASLQRLILFQYICRNLTRSRN